MNKSVKSVWKRDIDSIGKEPATVSCSWRMWLVTCCNCWLSRATYYYIILTAVIFMENQRKEGKRTKKLKVRVSDDKAVVQCDNYGLSVITVIKWLHFVHVPFLTFA